MTAPRGGARLLVVEDDPDAASVLADYLARAGFTVEIAHDLDEALAAAGARRPDVVITDIRLRGRGDGLDLARALADTDRPPVVFAVSGYATREDRARALAAGVADVFAKPFDPEALVARLRAGLQERSSG